MPELPYMPLYVADYLVDTQSLTTDQHGAYLLLIFHYWSNGGSIPDDDEELRNVTRLSNERWNAVRAKIQRFFEMRDGRWFHGRIEAELAKARNLLEQRRNAGKNSAKARSRSNEDSTSVGTDTHTSVDIRASDSDSKFLSSSSKQETLLEQEALLQPSKPKATRKEFEEDWPKFWRPLEAKEKAFDAYKKAREILTRDELMGHVAAHGPHQVALAKASGRHPIHQVTWLNQCRWTDEIAPVNGHSPPKLSKTEIASLRMIERLQREAREGLETPKGLLLNGE